MAACTAHAPQAAAGRAPARAQQSAPPGGTMRPDTSLPCAATCAHLVCKPTDYSRTGMPFHYDPAHACQRRPTRPPPCYVRWPAQALRGCHAASSCRWHRLIHSTSRRQGDSAGWAPRLTLPAMIQGACGAYARRPRTRTRPATPCSAPRTAASRQLVPARSRRTDRWHNPDCCAHEQNCSL